MMQSKRVALHSKIFGIAMENWDISNIPLKFMAARASRVPALTVMQKLSVSFNPVGQVSIVLNVKDSLIKVRFVISKWTECNN